MVPRRRSETCATRMRRRIVPACRCGLAGAVWSAYGRSMQRQLLPLLFAVAVAVSSVPAEPQPSTAPGQPRRGPPPAPPESTQFDFWVGAWNVYNPAGVKVGENVIEKISSNWGLLENWTNANGVPGKSLNSYNITKQMWQQFWVGSGGVLELSGGLENGAMVMKGEGVGANGAKIVNRITWTPNADGTVRQHWETSNDEGKTWTTSFDGLYRKR